MIACILVFYVALKNKGLEQSLLEFSLEPIPRAGLFQVQIVCVEEETEHAHCSLKISLLSSDQVAGDTTFNVPLNHHAHVTTFEHNERCEQGCCHLGTQSVPSERESEA
ncbi:hypothetical protein TNCV_4854711 [Trichonephila clavipes]|nr:hypothetical protein TNCV_4854711 [Trichonephila clavipes]